MPCGDQCVGWPWRLVIAGKGDPTLKCGSVEAAPGIRDFGPEPANGPRRRMWGCLGVGVVLHLVRTVVSIQCYDCNKKDRFKEIVSC